MNTVHTLPWDVNSVNMWGMPKERYHHGDLASALIEAGLDACRSQGPSGVVVRDLAARVGVSPAAAYRHFASLEHLRSAVSQRAREELGRRLTAARSSVQEGRSAADTARDRLYAIGSAYVRFALEEPRLFDTAFVPYAVPLDRPDDPDAWKVLVEAIDEMVDAGATPEALRADAPWIAWSAVHGLASILAQAGLPEAQDPERLIEGVLLGVQRALR